MEKDQNLDTETTNIEQVNELKSHFPKNHTDLWYNVNKIKDISDTVKRKLTVIIGICLFFICVEAIGAYISKSIAIFADVTHLLSDLLGFIVSLISVYLASKKANKKHSFGFVRAEIIGALFSVIFIWIMTVFILYEAIDRFVRVIGGEVIKIDPLVMLVTSFIGLGVNVVMACFLHGTGTNHTHNCGGGHDHKHGHSHGHKHHDHHDHHNHEPKLKIDFKEDHDHVHHENCNHETDHEQDEHKHEHNDLEHNHDHHDHNHDHHEHKHDHHDHNHEDEHLHGKNCNHSHDKNDKNYPLNLSENLLIKEQINKKRKNLNLSVKDAQHSQNVRAAFIHILGDMVQSIGVIIASLIIYFESDWVILDPIISIVFSIIAVGFSIPVTIQIMRLLLDATPDDLDLEQFKRELGNIKYVKEIHDLHVWDMTFGKPNMTAHIICSNYPDYVLKKATLVARKVGIYHSTIQVEISKNLFPINCEHNLHS